MLEHALFYYPYASLGRQQQLLLRATALYFDRLYLLDPAKASFGSVGPGNLDADVRLLEREGLLERVAPENVLHQHEAAIAAAIRDDLSDPGFRQLCAEKGNSRWTLALAKVPQAIRGDPRYQPIDESMRHILAGYAEGYAEYRETGTGATEFRYADYPFEVGEAIMLNHALVGSLLHAGAIPITDDPVHSRILNHKLEKARAIPAISAVLESRQRQQQFARASAAAQALPDVDLGAIPESLALEQILAYRRGHGAELQAAREKLGWMTREIAHEPWTKAFDDEVQHKLIPELHKQLQPARSSFSSWLKAAGIGLGGAAVVLGVFGNPLTPIAVGVAALTVAKSAGIDGLEWYQDWKSGKTQNGLHYLMRIR